jgi:hypothetical protein
MSIEPLNAPSVQGCGDSAVQIRGEGDKGACFGGQQTVYDNVRGKIGACKDFGKVLTGGHGESIPEYGKRVK